MKETKKKRGRKDSVDTKAIKDSRKITLIKLPLQLLTRGVKADNKKDVCVYVCVCKGEERRCTGLSSWKCVAFSL